MKNIVYIFLPKPVFLNLYINMFRGRMICVIMCVNFVLKLLTLLFSTPITIISYSAGKRHGADGTATAAGAAVYDFDANRHRRA